MMRLCCTTMCFSSSIICLLIVTTYCPVHGHHGEENAGADTSGMDDMESQENPHSSSDIKNSSNSSPQRDSLEDLTSHDYLTRHVSNSSSDIPKIVYYALRRRRSAELNDYLNSISSESSIDNNSADSSQSPVPLESLPSSTEVNKDASFGNHQNHSHNDSETTKHQSLESQVGLQQFSLTEKTSYDNNDNHDKHDHNHDGHNHSHEDHDHNHEDHDHNHEDHDHSHENHDHSHENHDHSHENHDHSHEDHDNSHNDHDRIHDKHPHKHDGHSHKGNDHEHHEEWELPPPDHEDSSSKHQQRIPKNYRHLSARVWLYASLAVVIISLCGLLSVAVIPIMQKWFYHTLLQFLVGLAVGSLSGDGLLHLMPHAILGGEESHDHNNHNHKALSLEAVEKIAIWRGLAALGGIFLFFIAERLLGVVTAYRRKSKEAKLSRHTTNMMPVMQREDGANNGSVGEKLAQPKKNSYDHIKEKDEKETIQMLQTEAPPSNKGSPQLTHEIGFHGRSSFSLEPEMSVAYRPDSESSVIISDHHGHSHGHSHEIPHSVSAVAWMVIMGDGLHNFCDGLAIGAAFASSDADGVSTTVAVFCHELPHELGDFAMLLKTGMKVKQALFYNGLSSILCFFGMIIGVCLGNVNSATNWVFAGTAGMFLYIALVDMLPELSSNEPGKAGIATLAVQVIGIVIGICVMLLIALYEHKLPAIVS